MLRSLRVLENRASVEYVTPVAREGYAHKEQLLALNHASIRGGSSARRSKYVDTVAERKMHAAYIRHLQHFLSFVNVDNLLEQMIIRRRYENYAQHSSWIRCIECLAVWLIVTIHFATFRNKPPREWSNSSMWVHSASLADKLYICRAIGLL